MVGGEESKTLMGNPNNKGISGDGVRVSEESKVSVGSSAGIVIGGSGWKAGDAGSLEINDKHDVSKQRVVEMMSRNNGWGSWGVMDLVGRVLEGKLSMDEEMEDIINSKNGPVVNLVPGTNAWQGVIGEPTSENGIAVKENTDNRDPKKLDAGDQSEGIGLIVKQDLVSNEIVPDGKLETEEVINVNADVLMSKECGAVNSVNDGVLIPKECGEVNSVDADVLIPKVHVVENNVNADVLIPKGHVEENNVNPDMLIPEERVELNNVVDMLTPKGSGEHHRTEKEGEYHVSDLVWGKVRSHPWWPGQIFAPSAASDKAKKYFKRESHLVSYFGDQTFAWNEEAKIKPFQMYFSQMERQSNADGFCHAVDCALDEVSRRVELGLSCPCLPQEIHEKIKFQEVASAGIREESSRIAGGDNSSSASSFLPGEFVQFLGSLAESPQSKTERLQFLINRAQLLAFNRWKGRHQLPVFEEFGELEDDTQCSVNGKGKDSPGSEGPNNFPSKKRKSSALVGSSWRRKHISGDEEFVKIKERCISVLMSSSSSSLQNDENERVKRTGRMTVTSAKNHETIPSDPQVKRRKRLLSPSSSGDVASQDKTYHGVRKSTSDSAEKSQLVEIIPAGIPTPDVILSELMLAAKNPLQRNDTMISVAGLLRELRNSTCLEKSCSESATTDKGKQPSSLETNDTFGFEGTKDSYWTDRIIQSYPQDQVLFEPETPNDSAPELEANDNVDNDKDRHASIMHLDQSLVMNEVSEEYSPTALILNFTNLESIPTITNLNEIFSRYGPLIEAETKILSKSKRAKVIFRRRADAETAFSSAGKYSIFGPALISYRLNYAPTPCATPKRSRTPF